MVAGRGGQINVVSSSERSLEKRISHGKCAIVLGLQPQVERREGKLKKKIFQERGSE